MPKSTKSDRNKRSATCANTASTIPESIDSTKVAVVPTVSSVSHSEEILAQEIEATICDYRGALEFSPSNRYAQSEAFPSLERGVDNKDTRLNETLSGERDSECSEISSSEDSCLVTSESDEGEFEGQCYSSDEDEQDDDDTVNVDSGLFTHDEKACKAVLAYVSRHCMTNEAAKDLIDLVKVTCPESVTFKSLNYRKVQEVCGQCEFHVYDICEVCHRLFPLDDENSFRCSTSGCVGLRYKGSESQQGKKEHKNSFVTVNIKNQLKDLLLRKEVWFTIQERIKRRGQSILTDILDGKFYMALCKEGQFLHSKLNISFIFNTDGAPLYSSSSVSLWPVFLAINELSSPERFSKQNMLMWGIWQGKGKPPFHVYFEPFASEMVHLYDEGLQVKPDCEELPITIKAAVILGSTDLQGKAYLTCMAQHNGQFGCLTCEEPGVVVKQGKGHTRCYPYRTPTEAVSKRTHESFLRNGLSGNRENKKVVGVYDVTSLAMMPWFDVVLGMVPDYMHGCLLGVTKTLLYKWFSATNYKKPYFIGGQVKSINKRILKMRPPDFLTRLPRDMEKHFKNLKASELQSWLLYYSLPCLVGYLPDKYLCHFAHLAEGVYILLGDGITPAQIARARDLLQTFYKDFQELYGNGSCGLNVHNTGAHLADYVEGWGPLWAWSTFGFEDMNGTIMDLTHGTGNVCRQVVWMLHAQSRLRCEVDMLENGVVKDFVKRMLNTKREVKNLKKAENCFIAGGAKKLVGLPQEIMEMIDEEVSGGNKFKVLRIVKNGKVFYSKEYTRMIKRNAYVVLFVCGKVGEVEFFVWDRQSGITLAVFREVKPDLQNPFFFSEAGHHTLRMKQERSEFQVKRIEEIKEKVLFLEGNSDHLCLVRIPNVCGVCG